MQSWKHHSLGMYLNFKIIMLVYYSQFVLLSSFTLCTLQQGFNELYMLDTTWHTEGPVLLK